MSRKRKDKRAPVSSTPDPAGRPPRAWNGPVAAVQVEPVESRLLAGGMIAATPNGVLLATDQGLDPALFDRESSVNRPLGASARVPPGALPPEALPPEADPLSPVGDPARGTGSAPAAYSSSCCGSCCGGSYSLSVWFEWVADASEADPSQPGAFRFHATASTCTGATLPTSVRVGFELEGDAIPGTDYDGPLTDGSVTIPLDVVYDYTMDKYSEGQVDETFNAIDEELDEPGAETVLCSIRGATDNLGRNGFWEAGQKAAQIISGDFTGRFLNWEGQDIGGDISVDDGVEDPDDPMVLPNGVPQDATVYVEIKMDGRPVPNVHVMLENGGDEGAVLLGDQPGPYEVNVLVRTTGPDGRASFTIRGKQGEAGVFGNEVSFKATWTNAEGDVQTKILHVHVRPAGS